ncbi:MAG TPA: hypothetical protein VJZ25_08905 [Gemmatimonadaceae bacterium]|nr:hypothetical protein [Gemmatimonadaceae bacterium]
MVVLLPVLDEAARTVLIGSVVVGAALDGAISRVELLQDLAAGLGAVFAFRVILGAFLFSVLVLHLS